MKFINAKRETLETDAEKFIDCYRQVQKVWNLYVELRTEIENLELEDNISFFGIDKRYREGVYNNFDSIGTCIQDMEEDYKKALENY